MPLRIEGTAADLSHGPHRAVRLLLFKCGAKTADAHVAVHLEGAEAVGHVVPFREDQNRWSGKLGENLAHDYFHGWRGIKLDSLPEEGSDRADPLGQITQEFAVLPHAAQQGTHLPEVPRHGHFDQG